MGKLVVRFADSAQAGEIMEVKQALERIASRVSGDSLRWSIVDDDVMAVDDGAPGTNSVGMWNRMRRRLADFERRLTTIERSRETDSASTQDLQTLAEAIRRVATGVTPAAPEPPALPNGELPAATAAGRAERTAS